MKITIDLDYEDIIIAMILYMDEGYNMHTKKLVREAINWYLKHHYSNRHVVALINEAIDEYIIYLFPIPTLSKEEMLKSAHQEWDENVKWCLQRGKKLNILPKWMSEMDVKTILFTPPANTYTKELLIKDSI